MLLLAYNRRCTQRHLNFSLFPDFVLPTPRAGTLRLASFGEDVPASFSPPQPPLNPKKGRFSRQKSKVWLQKNRQQPWLGREKYGDGRCYLGRVMHPRDFRGVVSDLSEVSDTLGHPYLGIVKVKSVSEDDAN